MKQKISYFQLREEQEFESATTSNIIGINDIFSSENENATSSGTRDEK